MKDNPAPSNIGDDIDESDGGFFDVYDFDHVIEVFSQVKQILTDLDGLVDLGVLLDVLKGTDEVLDLSRGISRV